MKKRLSFRSKMIIGICSILLVFSFGIIGVLSFVSQNIELNSSISFRSESIGAKIYFDFYHKIGTNDPIALNPIGQNILSDEDGYYFVINGGTTGSNQTITIPDVELEAVPTILPNGTAIHTSFVHYGMRIINTGSRDIYLTVDDDINDQVDNLVCDYSYLLGPQEYAGISASRTLSRQNGFEILNSNFANFAALRSDSGTALAEGSVYMDCYAEDTSFNINSSRVDFQIDLMAITYVPQTNGLSVTEIDADEGVSIAEGVMNLYVDGEETPTRSYDLITGAALVGDLSNHNLVASPVEIGDLRHVDAFIDFDINSSLTIEISLVNGTQNSAILLFLDVLGMTDCFQSENLTFASNDENIANMGSNANTAMKTAKFRRTFRRTSNNFMSLSLSIRLEKIVNNSASVTNGFNYSASGKGYSLTGISSFSSNMVMPNYYNGLVVTGIGSRLLFNQSGLTRCVLPQGLTTFGRGLFIIVQIGLVHLQFQKA